MKRFVFALFLLLLSSPLVSRSCLPSFPFRRPWFIRVGLFGSLSLVMFLMMIHILRLMSLSGPKSLVSLNLRFIGIRAMNSALNLCFTHWRSSLFICFTRFSWLKGSVPIAFIHLMSFFFVYSSPLNLVLAPLLLFLLFSALLPSERFHFTLFLLMTLLFAVFLFVSGRRASSPPSISLPCHHSRLIFLSFCLFFMMLPFLLLSALMYPNLTCPVWNDDDPPFVHLHSSLSFTSVFLLPPFWRLTAAACLSFPAICSFSPSDCHATTTTIITILCRLNRLHSLEIIRIACFYSGDLLDTLLKSRMALTLSHLTQSLAPEAIEAAENPPRASLSSSPREPSKSKSLQRFGKFLTFSHKCRNKGIMNLSAAAHSPDCHDNEHNNGRDRNTNRECSFSSSTLSPSSSSQSRWPSSSQRDPRQVMKLQDRVIKCREEVQKTREKYESALREISDYNSKYSEDMTEVFEKCQEFEEKRLVFFKEMLFAIHGCLNISADPKLPIIYEEYRHTIQNADASKDLKWWSNNHGTGMPQNWPVFEVSPHNIHLLSIQTITVLFSGRLLTFHQRMIVAIKLWFLKDLLIKPKDLSCKLHDTLCRPLFASVMFFLVDVSDDSLLSCSISASIHIPDTVWRYSLMMIMIAGAAQAEPNMKLPSIFWPE